MENAMKALFVWAPLATLAVLVPAVAAHGFGTVLWQIDTAEQFEEGELDQVVVSSLGGIKLGSRLTRVDLQDVALVWSLARGPGGAVVLGTGNNGKVFQLEGTHAREIAKLDCLVVTALTFGEPGTIYAGTLPSGKVFRLEPGTGGPAKVEQLVDLEKADHVWALQYDTKRKVLFAATGPEGVVYSIDRTGRAEVYYDSADDHVLSLLLEEPGGDLLAGTSPKALLLRVTGPGRAVALHDFDDTEVKGIAEGTGGDLYLAVNAFPSPAVKTEPQSSSTEAKAKGASRPKPGKGKIFRRRPDGSIEPLLEFGDGHLTSIEAPGDGLVYAGTGNKGRVVAVDDDRVSFVMMDVDERQVLAVSLAGDQPIIATGDAGAVYRADKAAPGLAEYRSAPLDAGFVSRWGSLEWRGEGQLVLQTRSGHTKEPDETWSDWSAPVPSSGSPIGSPAARYLQIRVRWSRDPGAVLRALGVFHVPHNQRAVITEVSVDTPFEVDRPAEKSAEGGGAGSKAGRGSADAQEKRSSVLKVTWKVDNPDGDPVRYRLSFREESEKVWRPILPSDLVLTSASYDWSTEAVPAGYYLVKVEVSDELENPAGVVLRHEKVSPPVVVDNQPPRLEGLTAAARKIGGRAIDDFSPIAALEYSLDGRSWLPVSSDDGIFDATEERFAFDLPSDLAPGSYVVAVRALDRARNAGTARLTTTVR
jgi:hypothetical protein